MPRPFLATVLLLAVAASAAAAAEAATVRCFAGGGDNREGGIPAHEARLIRPFGVDFTADGTAVVVEMEGERVCAVDPDGTLRILADAGVPGPADAVQLAQPHGVTLHDGDLYIADSSKDRVLVLPDYE